MSAEAYQVAVGLLTRRDHSTLELFGKLNARHYAQEEITQTLRALAEQGLLNDSRFGESYVRQRVEKGFGPIKIRAELRTRGLDRQLIEQLLAGYAEQWPARTVAALRKRFGNDISVDQDMAARQARFLEARGFLTSDIHALLF